MAKNTDANEERMKTPDEDGQVHCDPSLSSTEVLVEPNNQDVIEKMLELKKNKKKKCRGDRKAQHKRRRLRRQQRKVNEKQTIPMEPNAVCLQNDPNEEQIQVGWSFFRWK